MHANEMSARSTRNLRIAGWSLAAALLALPAMAMLVGAEGVDWSASDFVFAAAVFAVVGGLFELAARASRNLAYRAAVAVAVGCAFLQLWITLAVGIIGNEDNPANWTYMAMVVLAPAVSAVAWGRARSMVRAMLVLLVTQAIFTLLHLADGHFTVIIDTFFGTLWFLASRLFARAEAQIASVNP